jgi:putative ABC transport system permease protein
MFKGAYFENIKIALQSIKSQLLRTVITGLIIALGIMALVGILTAIDAMKASLSGQFALLGANTFSIQNRGSSINIGRGGKRQKPFSAITFRQAQEFKERFNDQPALVSIAYIATGVAQAGYESKKTNPNIQVWAADENYLETAGYELESGRDISEGEVKKGSSVAVIGQDIKTNLFGKVDPIGKVLEIGGKKYKVIGLVKPKGNAMGFGGDKTIFVPITKARANFSRANQTYSINVMTLRAEMLDPVISEATSMMRKVRRLDPKADNDFSITKSDSLSQQLITSLGFIALAAIIIATITLFGASIALMNIMLVSVTERTKEIGIRKAIGAKKKTIRIQFLTEAVVICLLGGVLGIIMGLGIGNLISSLVDGSFIVPWNWMILAIIICLVVGLISGIYPAYKASKLDPIDALRYE